MGLEPARLLILEKEKRYHIVFRKVEDIKVFDLEVLAQNMDIIDLAVVFDSVNVQLRDSSGQVLESLDLRHLDDILVLSF